MSMSLSDPLDIADWDKLTIDKQQLKNSRCKGMPIEKAEDTRDESVFCVLCR